MDVFSEGGVVVGCELVHRCGGDVAVRGTMLDGVHKVGAMGHRVVRVTKNVCSTEIIGVFLTFDFEIAEESLADALGSFEHGHTRRRIEKTIWHHECSEGTIEFTARGGRGCASLLVLLILPDFTTTRAFTGGAIIMTNIIVVLSVHTTKFVDPIDTFRFCFGNEGEDTTAIFLTEQNIETETLFLECGDIAVDGGNCVNRN